MNEITADARTGVQTRPELFVAYAESDTGWVHGFLLPELGLDPRSVLTPHDFRPGAALVEELDRAVETARLTVLVLSRAFGMSQWSAFAELLATHDTLRRNSGRLVPVLLEAYQLPLHLDFRVRLDFTDRSRWEAEAARLRHLLERDAPPAERLPCPYPGLLAFGPEEAGLFFGRDRESDDITRRLGQHNFLLVVGPSGSGKSSLLSAGVLPRLMASDAGRWLVRTLRPDPATLRWLTKTFGDGSPAACANPWIPCCARFPAPSGCCSASTRRKRSSCCPRSRIRRGSSRCSTASAGWTGASCCSRCAPTSTPT